MKVFFLHFLLAVPPEAGVVAPLFGATREGGVTIDSEDADPMGLPSVEAVEGGA